MKKKFAVARARGNRTKSVVLEKVYELDSYEFYVGVVPGQKNVMFGCFDIDKQKQKQIGFTVPFGKAKRLADLIYKNLKENSHALQKSICIRPTD